MITFKKREIIYRPYEWVLKLIVDIIMIVCFTYLFVTSFFGQVTIVGHSMNDTLLNEQVVLVNSIAYKLSSPKRYDIVVFKPDIGNVSDKYIKRVIGLPGETVQIIDGFVYIDGDKLENDVINTQIYNPGIASDPVKLGYNEYFVLGDNRNNSDDSRFSNVGFVNKNSIIGKPWMIVSPVSSIGSIKCKQINNEEETTTAK